LSKCYKKGQVLLMTFSLLFSLLLTGSLAAATEGVPLGDNGMISAASASSDGDQGGEGDQNGDEEDGGEDTDTDETETDEEIEPESTPDLDETPEPSPTPRDLTDLVEKSY
jgi:hypothetical protein